MAFRDREQAGQQLATRVAHLAADHPVVLGLARGGVPVAREVARALDAELDVLVARKIGAPQYPEYALGAVAEGGALYVRPGALLEAGVDEEALSALVRRETVELARRVRAYRGGRPLPALEGRTAIVVDDGLATGTTMRAALQALRLRRPARLVLAVPVAPRDTLQRLAAEVDESVCLATPSPFRAVGEHYLRFPQLEDDEVTAALDSAQAGGAAQPAALR